GVRLGLDPRRGAGEVIQQPRAKLKNRIPPITVLRESAPVNDNRLQGADIDLGAFAAPRHWPLDGGRYIGTADVVMTRDPDLGHINLGTYRMMVHDRNHVGLYLSPGKDARLHITRAWQRGEDVQVAAALGVHPLWMIVASQTFPKNLSEYEAIGGIMGVPLQVVEGDTTDLLLPAYAEIVIEGVIGANSTRLEGPFGEFTGYYGRPEAGAPFVEVTAIHHRDSPILTNALMADYPSCDIALFYSITKSAPPVGRPGQVRDPRHQGSLARPRRGVRFRDGRGLARAALRRPRGPGPRARRPGSERRVLHKMDRGRR